MAIRLLSYLFRTSTPKEQIINTYTIPRYIMFRERHLPYKKITKFLNDESPKEVFINTGLFILHTRTHPPKYRYLTIHVSS